MREISELQIGQVVNIPDNELGSLKLLSPRTDQGKSQIDNSDKIGTLVELMDSHNQLMDSLIIGKIFTRKPDGRTMPSTMGYRGYPDGQYVRKPGSSSFLVSQTLNRLTESINTWLDNEFIHIKPSDIQQITVTGPGRPEIKLVRKNNDSDLTIEGLNKSQEPDVYKISQMAGALQYLTFDGVVSPTLAPKQTGLDQPVVFTTRTKQGQIYILRIGSTVSKESSDRYVKVAIKYEEPKQDVMSTADEQKDSESTSQKLAETTKALNSKLSKWIYIIKSYRTDSLLLTRDELIKKKEADQAGAKPQPSRTR